MYKRREYRALEQHLLLSMYLRGTPLRRCWALIRLVRLSYFKRSSGTLWSFLYHYPALLSQEVTGRSYTVIASPRTEKVAPALPYQNNDVRLNRKKGTYMFDENVTATYWELVNFLRYYNIRAGYRDLKFSNLVAKEDMLVTGQLPKFRSEQFNMGYRGTFLSPTGEVQLGNLRLVKVSEAKYCTFSACFRRELNYGSKSKGWIRTLEFEKYELFTYTTADRSHRVHRLMLVHVTRLLDLVELPYRVVQLCPREASFGAGLTFDVEVRMPDGSYLEVSSISNCGEFQTRRRGTRLRGTFMHTLNGSCLPIGRTLLCLLAWYDQGALRDRLRFLLYNRE